MASVPIAVSRDRRLIPDGVYREILWHIPVGLAVINVVDPADLGASVIISANPAALRMKDFAPDEVIGKQLREVLPQVLDGAYPDKVAEVLRTGRPLDLGFLRGVRHPERTYSVNVFPLPDDCVGISFEDVTSQQGQIEAEERFWKAFQAAPFAMCVMRYEGRVVEANQRFLELFGFARREELVARSNAGIWASRAEQERVLKAIEQQREIREALIECRVRGGRTFRAVAALETIKFGGDNCIMALFWRTE